MTAMRRNGTHASSSDASEAHTDKQSLSVGIWEWPIARYVLLMPYTKSRLQLPHYSESSAAVGHAR